MHKVRKIAMAPLIIDKDEKKRSILKAAMSVFSRSGYHESKIADIAREAGIGKGTVYEYFKDKETLFMELFVFLIEDHLQYLSGRSSVSISAARRLEDIIRGTFEAFASMENIYYIFLDLKIRHLTDAGTSFYREQFSRLYREFRHEIAAIIRAGISEGVFHCRDPEQTATLIIALMEGIMNQWIADRDALHLERIRDAVRNMIMSYVTFPPASSPL